MLILNLGCGTRTSDSTDVVNIDWTMYLRLRRSKLLQPFVPLLLKGQRLERYRKLPNNILVHNLAHGIPFGDDAVDVVYHSHLLEHLDRDVAPRFLAECLRVLKPGGYLRIVVPDFEKVCREYIGHVDACARDDSNIADHDRYLEPLLEQSVRRHAFGMRANKGLRGWIESTFVGDARRRGETHQWMYDRFNLKHLLLQIGFDQVRQLDHQSSGIAGWQDYALDVEPDGHPYKPNSLYVEARKPNGSDEGVAINHSTSV